MECRNCLHFSVCQYRRGRELLPIGNQCSDFADRSQWVHLSCKVGDTVFCLYDRDYGEYKVVTMNIDPLGKLKIRVECNIHGHEKIEDCPEEFCGQPFCVGYLDADDFGKTIFLTREEAEETLKALEGMKSE